MKISIPGMLSRGSLLQLFVIVILLAFLVPSYNVFRAHLDPYAPTFRTFLDIERKKLSIANDGRYQSIKYINNDLDKSLHKVLTFRQSDIAFYSKIPFLSHLDKKLLDIFSISNSEQGKRALESFGITHLLIPNYAVPAIYNSFIYELIGDYEQSALLFQSNGYRVFALKVFDNPMVEVNESLSQIDWATDWEIIRGKKYSIVDLYREALRFRAVSNAGGLISDNIGDNSLSFLTLRGPRKISPLFTTQPPSVRASSQATLAQVLHAKVGFSGVLSIYLLEYNESGKLIDRTMVDQILHKEIKDRDLSLQYLTRAETTDVRVELQLVGKGVLEVPQLEVSSLYTNDMENLPVFAQSAALAGGFKLKAEGLDDKVIDFGISRSGVAQLLGGDSRPYYLTSDVFILDSSPAEMSFRARGVGSIDVILEASCNAEDGCQYTRNVGTYVLADDWFDYGIVDFKKQHQKGMRLSGDYFNIDEYMSFPPDATLHKARLTFRLYIDPKDDRYTQASPELEISNINFD